jgi:hypothetical protein
LKRLFPKLQDFPAATATDASLLSISSS